VTVVSYWLLMSFEEGFSINAQDARLLLTDTYYGNNHYPYLHLMLYIILGASCGALGHVFNTAVVLMGKLRKRYVVRSAYRCVAASCCNVRGSGKTHSFWFFLNAGHPYPACCCADL
jgi:H+/Cl- antiporter ClcA